MEAWQQLLTEVVSKIGQAETARRLGVSPATVSQVTNDKYPADPGNIADKIITIFGDETMQEEQKIPKGYRKDAYGRLVPESMIKDVDLARDELVREIAAEALALNEEIKRLRAKWLGDIAAFSQLSAEKYGAKIGGNKGNASLPSFDGAFKIVQAIQEYLVFDERLQAAKALIDECIKDWAKGSSQEILVLIDDAFQVDKQGQVNTKRVLSLRKLNFEDERWQKAMEAISDSLTVCGSKTYLRVYRRDPNDHDKYEKIPLGIASS